MSENEQLDVLIAVYLIPDLAQDDFDAFTQAVNWIRTRPQGRTRTWSSFKQKQTT